MIFAKGDRPAKCVDYTAFFISELNKKGPSLFEKPCTLLPGLGCLRRSTPLCITQRPSPASRPGLFYLSAFESKLSTLPNKKAPHFVRGLCYPTWIRTKTYRSRICRTTFILSGNWYKNTLLVKGGCKNKLSSAANKMIIKKVSLIKGPPLT